MTNKINLSLPVWQSRVLLGAGLAALAAAELGAGVYAFQSASASQEVWGLPVDAALKTVLSVAAGLGVAFGAAVTAWLWRTGRKGLRRQAWLAMAMTVWALAISVGNLSGYFAWTRAQHAAETVRESTAYRVALERISSGAYVPDDDRRLVRRGEAPADAEREFGDVGKAFGVHILILGFGAAFRLPAPAKRKRQTKQIRAKGKPRLAVSN
ncbi:MAG: hypothetical protein AB7P35_17635 [Hyphomonadaceae bacterium]